MAQQSTMEEQTMQRRVVNAPEAPPIAPYYSQAIEVSGAARTLYISGQVGVDADGKLAVDFSTQCRQTFLNLQAQLRAADEEPDPKPPKIFCQPQCQYR
jgi:2-iminobutanoate/2-iminopropanoate deaminase